MGIVGNDKNIRVQILYSEGCPNTTPTLELVKNIAKDLNIVVDIEMVMVGTQEQAQELHFLGSPTVQIDGLDIEPSAIDSLAFGLTWRSYGASGVPPEEMIRKALQRCAEEHGVVRLE